MPRPDFLSPGDLPVVLRRPRPWRPTARDLGQVLRRGVRWLLGRPTRAEFIGRIRGQRVPRVEVDPELSDAEIEEFVWRLTVRDAGGSEPGLDPAWGVDRALQIALSDPRLETRVAPARRTDRLVVSFVGHYRRETEGGSAPSVARALRSDFPELSALSPTERRRRVTAARRDAKLLMRDLARFRTTYDPRPVRVDRSRMVAEVSPRDTALAVSMSLDLSSRVLAVVSSYRRPRDSLPKFEAVLSTPPSLSQLNQFEVAGPPPPPRSPSPRDSTLSFPSAAIDQLAPRLRIFEFTPRGCGHRHRHLRTILACVERNGVPGFEVREIAEGASPAP